MAVGLSTEPVWHSVKGVRLAAVSAGIRYASRKDLVLIELAPQSTTAGVFTQNSFCAAPVVVAKQYLQQTNSRFWLINAGNANAGTGERGLADARACCEAMAKASNVDAAEVLPFSTGVIGEFLPVEKIVKALPLAMENLAPENWLAAAKGIMTTDTVPKLASRQLVVDGKTVTLTGMSKGAGMIKPDMATMLAYVATDAKVPQALLQSMLSVAANKSFNRISIDGDTSTNDACMVAASGQSGWNYEVADAATKLRFEEAFTELLIELAQAIVRDGEGATKFITVQVEQAASVKEALDVAYNLAHSPLVKTAFFASDANWGRILAVVGRSGIVDFDLSRVSIWLNDVAIVEAGMRAETYSDAKGQTVMSQAEITVRIALGRGDVQETLWTTDLSHEYVRINAEYRT